MVKSYFFGWLIVALAVTLPWSEQAAAASASSTVSSLAELDEALGQARGRPALVRVRADWNISDAEIDKQLSSDCLQQALSDVTWLEWDVTANNEADREFLAKYQVFGPPTFLLFDTDGNHLDAQEIVGYLAAEEIVAVLTEAFGLPEDSEFSACRATESANEAVSWQELIDKSYDYLYEQQEALGAIDNMAEHNRWDIDQDNGTLTFSNDDVPLVVANIAIAGSVITSQNTWRWSWANPSIDPKLSAPIEVVRQYGAEHGLDKLTDRGWPAEEIDGWEMVAIANYLLQGKGAYRAPAGDLLLFVVITDIRNVE